MLFKDRAAVFVVYYAEEESEEEDYKELKVWHQTRNLIMVNVVKQEKSLFNKRLLHTLLPADVPTDSNTLVKAVMICQKEICSETLSAVSNPDRLNLQP